MSEDWPATALDVKLAHDRLQTRRLELLARYAHVRELADEELDSREIEQEENAAELWDALRRLDAGSYGICVDCGDNIDQNCLGNGDAPSECERCDDDGDDFQRMDAAAGCMPSAVRIATGISTLE